MVRTHIARKLGLIAPDLDMFEHWYREIDVWALEEAPVVDVAVTKQTTLDGKIIADVCYAPVLRATCHSMRT
jgi:hypothetical protein